MLLLLVNTLLGTTHDVVVGQFGPVTTICAVDVLKLLPLMVNENVPGVVVLGEILLIDGVEDWKTLVPTRKLGELREITESGDDDSGASTTGLKEFPLLK